MCGIAGVFDLRPGATIERATIDRMNHTIAHRGPDDAGVFLGPQIGLGHRRLSIIDVAGGHQPLSNEDGTVWVMLNGEIYNYLELRAELLARGHRFQTVSDTEAIAHLYEEVGAGCFERLRGMFSVAIWDGRERKLVLARDRVGKKPLFYCVAGGRLLFGSEIKALLAAGDVPPDLDLQALSDYFSLGYIPAPKTIYRSVRKVRPAHYLVVTAAAITERAYWDLSFGQVEPRSEAEWTARLHDQLREAVRVRLMSEVPLGAFLSGGVDSSIVVALMSELLDQPATTCSIGFIERAFDESGYARQVAQRLGTNHKEEVVEPNALEVLDTLVWHYDEPFADSSAIPTYYVSKVARQHVTVALGGDGGDEHFAGYRRYYFDRLENRGRALLPAWFRRPVFGLLGQAYPALAWAPRAVRARATFQSLGQSPLEGYFNSVSLFRPDEKARLLSPGLREALQGYDSLDVFEHHYQRAGTTDLLSRIQYVDIKTYLTDDILAKVDRASMAVSLEVRAPLLDHLVMETAARMPPDLKLRGRTGKYILKQVGRAYFPAEWLDRPKQGFAVPLAQWFRKELRPMAEALLLDARPDVLDPRYLRTIWQEHQRGTHDRSAHLWAILMFVKWQERFAAGRLQQ